MEIHARSVGLEARLYGSQDGRRYGACIKTHPHQSCSPSTPIKTTMAISMNGSNKNPRHYKWPWIVAAAVVLGIVLAVIWVTFAVKKVESERDVNGPLPNGTPVH